MSIFARSALRSARPFQQSIRHYATEGAPKSSSNVWTIGALVGAGAAGGYYYINRSGSTAAAVENVKQAVKPSGNEAFKGGDQGFLDLKLESIENVNHNTKKFRFALPQSDDVSGMKVASALLTKFQDPGMEKPVLRPYTPISDENAVGYMDLLVKKYPDGPMSTHIHNLQPNQTLSIKGPLPKYPLGPNQHSHIGLIAGGTGITPMYQLCRQIFNNPSDTTKVTLVFGNIAEEDILLKKEFDDLENTYPQRFRAFYVLDNPPEGWQGGKGYITKDLLKTVLPEPKTEGIKMFVCGPEGLYKAVSGTKVSPKDQGELSGILKELGYSQEQVYKF